MEHATHFHLGITPVAIPSELNFLDMRGYTYNCNRHECNETLITRALVSIILKEHMAHPRHNYLSKDS
eukprot:jgi/Botrbrau1/12322/Bobra.0205s0020.1